MSRYLRCVFALASICFIGLSDSRAADEISVQSKTDSSALSVGTLQAKAGDLDLAVGPDGTHLLRLRGNVSVDIGDVQASSDSAEISFSSESKIVLSLVGNVWIRTAMVRGSAHSAKFDSKSAILELNGAEGQSATLHNKVSESEGRIVAGFIRFNGRTHSIEAFKTATVLQPLR